MSPPTPPVEQPAAAASAPARSFTGIRRERRTRWTIALGDTVSRLVITVGGLGTIVAVLFVCFFLVMKSWPLFGMGRLDQPVPVTDVGGTLRVELNHADPAALPLGYRNETNDARILTVALGLAAEGRDVTLVTKDMPLRVKAAAVGLRADEYRQSPVTDPTWTGMVVQRVRVGPVSQPANHSASAAASWDAMRSSSVGSLTGRRRRRAWRGSRPGHRPRAGPPRHRSSGRR